MRIHKPSIARDITIAEDFCAQCAEVREYALGLEYKTEAYQGFEYQGIGRGRACVEDLMAEAMGFPVDIQMQFFRLGVVGDRLTSWIHADSVCADWACVWYLTPDDLVQKGTGTGFWRHRHLGWRGLPAGRIDQQMADRLNADGQTEEAWELEEIVAMRFNRAVFYPTSLFHGRYPEAAFGDDLQTGRLIWCSFFNKA